MPDLAGKKVLITGAASGIGRALAIASAAKGAELCLTDVAGEHLQSAAEEIRASGGTVHSAVAADISDYDAVAAMANRIHAAHGSIDVLMNVAGIAIWGTVESMSHEQWRRVVDVNLMGPIHTIESFVPVMIEAGRGGHIVNVSSAAGLFGLPWHGAYSATKFGLRGLSEVLRFDLRRHKIGVSLACPGAVDTGLVDTLEIAGVDRNRPLMKNMTGRFAKHAATPEQAAERIIRGVERNRYWVYTSRDIQLAHFWQRRFETPYTWIMRAANDRFAAVAGRSG